MFDLKLPGPEFDRQGAFGEVFEQTVTRVRAWLQEAPSPVGILEHLPALELALAAHVKNRDPEILSLARDALKRANDAAALESFGLTKLAALMNLNLRAYLLTRDQAFRGAAERTARAASNRFDADAEYFREGAEQAIFDTGANAVIAEAFYLAWRVLDKQDLRAQVGEVLPKVSDMVEPRSGVYARRVLPDGAPQDTQDLSVYAPVIQMFLTASEVTGRGTYATRGRIVANLMPERMADAKRAKIEVRVALAEALIRLVQFCGEDAYRHATIELLESVPAHGAPSGIDAASFALVVEHARNFPLHAVIVGNVESDENARVLWFAAVNQYASARAIEVLDPEQHAPRIQALGYYAAPDSALAYLCLGPVCLPPVRTPTDLERAIRRFRTSELDS